MSDFKLRLTVNGSPTLEGDGENVVWKVHAFRTTKTGRREVYALQLDCCRHSIQQIVRQIASMHERDRERLAWETARIQKEIKAIEQPEAQS